MDIKSSTTVRQYKAACADVDKDDDEDENEDDDDDDEGDGDTNELALKYVASLHSSRIQMSCVVLWPVCEPVMALSFFCSLFHFHSVACICRWDQLKHIDTSIDRTALKVKAALEGMSLPKFSASTEDQY